MEVWERQRNVFQSQYYKLLESPKQTTAAKAKNEKGIQENFPARSRVAEYLLPLSYQSKNKPRRRLR